MLEWHRWRPAPDRNLSILYTRAPRVQGREQADPLEWLLVDGRLIIGGSPCLSLDERIVHLIAAFPAAPPHPN